VIGPAEIEEMITEYLEATAGAQERLRPAMAWPIIEVVISSTRDEHEGDDPHGIWSHWFRACSWPN
jgi:hypothetical protein